MITYNTYPDIMNTNEVCEYLNISKPTCLTLLNAGTLPGFKINNSRSWRVCKPLLKRYVNASRANNYKY